jgi:hypothetical protein
METQCMLTHTQHRNQCTCQILTFSQDISSRQSQWAHQRLKLFQVPQRCALDRRRQSVSLIRISITLSDRSPIILMLIWQMIIAVTCPGCSKKTATKTSCKCGSKIAIWACVLCLPVIVGCPPCCCIPCLFPRCYEYSHSCISCNRNIGTSGTGSI